MDQIIRWGVALTVIAVLSHYMVIYLIDNNQTVDVVAQRTLAKTAAPQPSTQTRDEGPEPIEDPLPGRAVRLEAGANGHFYLDAKVNGTMTSFLVDTGASIVALSYDAAQKAGIRPQPSDFKYPVSTANGETTMAVVTLDSIRYKNILVRDVQAGILPKGALGGANLLGNSFLSRLSEYKVSDGTLIMRP